MHLKIKKKKKNFKDQVRLLCEVVNPLSPEGECALNIMMSEISGWRFLGQQRDD